MLQDDGHDRGQDAVQRPSQVSACLPQVIADYSNLSGLSCNGLGVCDSVRRGVKQLADAKKAASLTTTPQLHHLPTGLRCSRGWILRQAAYNERRSLIDMIDSRLTKMLGSGNIVRIRYALLDRIDRLPPT